LIFIETPGVADFRLGARLGGDDEHGEKRGQV
jgi:hypothetical protein